MEGVAVGLVLVEGVAGELVLVEGGDGTAEDASLTAHSRPSFGGQRVEGLEWARLATKLTRVRLLRLLKYASSSLFLMFVNTLLSHGNFFTKYAKSMVLPSSSSE